MILVTHQLQFLEKADKIVILHDGETIACGKYDELMAAGIDFLAFLEGTRKNETEKSGESEKEMIRKQVSLESFSEESIKEEKCRQAIDNEAKLRLRDEIKSTGSVKASVYWNYMRAGSNVFYILFVFAIAIFSQGLYHYTDLWLSKWTRDYDVNTEYGIRSSVNNSTLENQTTFNNTNLPKLATLDSEMNNVITYCILMAILFVSAFVRTSSLFYLCLRCSVNLHNNIFRKLLRAPLLFFENNPLGMFCSIQCIFTLSILT